MAQASSDRCSPQPVTDQADVVSCPAEMAVLEELLGQVEAAGEASGGMPSVVDPSTDQRLVEGLLGNATGLFVALRCKHAATATHSLHVAFLCSAWARKMEIPPEKRYQIEVASLLHDVGIIGIPDRILHKPASLESHETGIMAHARRLAEEILRAAGAAASLLAIVENIPVWYNSSARNGELAGVNTPAGARMIAIAEAFDSMTTDHVYRTARSKEQALLELVRCAGTQFDPLLVDQFAQIARQDLSQLYRQLASQWLRDLAVDTPRLFGDGGYVSRQEHRTGVMARFHGKILDNLRDGVIMVDPALNIIGWNRRLEQLTGMVAESLVERPWQPELLEMRDDEGRLVLGPRCPLRQAVATGMPSSGRFSLALCNQGQVAVDTQIIPVVDSYCSLLGAVMIMRDVSSERSLKKLCENLQVKATVDPLTRLSNRAEFDRVHADLMQKYHKDGSLFSVVICDLDHFKQINDNYGHQAGDEVLQKTAAVIQEHSPSGDLVARYGGEEFVILAADCGIAAATRRAEQIRDAISQLEHGLLGGHRTTASFGVTQVQPGDTAETVLRRADRALYLAKDQGRNRVIQLGTGTTVDEPVRRWAFWRRKKTASPEVLVEEHMIAPAPIQLALEKLRGFVADHLATVRKTEENILELELIAAVYNARRKADLPFTFLMRLEFSDETPTEADLPNTPRNEAPEIQIHVVVSLEEASMQTDGRLTDYARQMTTSLRAYLMAKKASDPGGDEDGRQRNKIMLPSWTDQSNVV